MGTKVGGENSSLKDRLYEDPTRFQFFQAVRMLHALHPERAPIGRDHDPGEEVVRFRSSLSYAFPIGDIARLKPGEEDRPDEMVVNFLGVATPSSFGSLPTPYIEELRRQERAHRSGMRDFLDSFNHRLVSLFYRAWERSRPDVLDQLGARSPFAAALSALIGLEGESIRERLPFDVSVIANRAGVFSSRAAAACSLEALVESLVGVPSQIEQFVPTWYEIDSADRARLGVARTRLGSDINLGQRICLVQSHFRIRIGPMDFSCYQQMLPGTEAFRLLSSVVRLAAKSEFDFEFNLVLERKSVPRLRLGKAPTPAAPFAGRLGWTTWLATQTPARDADQALFVPSTTRERSEHRPMEMKS